MSTRIHLFIICIVDLKTLFCFPRIKTTSHLMFFGLLREEDQTFQRMVKNGMKSGKHYCIHLDNHASHTYQPFMSFL